MQKRHAWPKGHWNWPIKVSHKHGVRCGNLIWVGGQVDLNSYGEVLHPNDLEAQTAVVVTHIERVLQTLKGTLTDLVHLNCFYVNTGEVNETAFSRQVASNLPSGTCTAITLIPVPALAYPGMQVEIEAIAMRGEDDAPLPRQYAEPGKAVFGSTRFASAVRCEKMIFVSAQYPLDETGNVCGCGSIVTQSRTVGRRIREKLRLFGADFDDVVKINRWYVGSDKLQDFEPAALEFAGNFTEPGPAATGIPLPRHADPQVLITVSVIAMLGENGDRLPRKHVWPESLWDWHVPLPYQHGLKCDRMIFLGGQVALDKRGRAVYPGDLGKQTRQAMTHIRTILNALGADYDDVCKVLALYQGQCGEQALNANLPIRSACFEDPGPATTGIPLPKLAYQGMHIEIDIYAMAKAND